MRKSIKTYNGGKNGSGTYQQIINLIPHHNLYIEGFLGSGAIYKNKVLADKCILIDKDPEIKKFLPGSTIYNFDTISFIETSYPLINIIHNSGTAVFIYLDPPYPFFTRRDPKKKLYKIEMTNQDHEKLLVAAGNLKCYVMISSYKNELYNNFLKGWNTHEFEVQTRHGKATECLYFNYPKPEILHDYRYVGNNYREREFLKAQKNRTVHKILKMPAVQRNSILSELIMQLLPGNNIKNKVL